MARFVIVGAGGHGREIHEWVSTSPRFCAENEIGEIVFVNDITPAVESPAPVISTIDAFRPLPSDLIVCALGEPSDRRNVISRLHLGNKTLCKFVHDQAIVASSAQLGAGVVICPRAVVSPDVTIGENTHVNVSAFVAHDVKVGDFSTIGPGALLLGGSRVGGDAYIGSGATVLPNRSVGDGAVVGAQAAVVVDIKAGAVAVGVPARETRTVPSNSVASGGPRAKARSNSKFST